MQTDMCTFVTNSVSLCYSLEWRNVSDTRLDKIKPQILSSATFFNSENRAVYEIMWKIWFEPDRPQKQYDNGACALHAGYLRP